MADKGRRIMAVGGHVGDMELTAGALLAQNAVRGGKNMLVALTAGERGNPPHMNTCEYRLQKVAEAKAFAERLNGESLVFDVPDGELEAGKDNSLALARVIRSFRPDVLITHWEKSIHKDHRMTHLIVRDAQFYAGLGSFPLDDLPSCWAAGPYFAENWEDPYDFRPLVYVDVSDGYALWNEAITLHWFVRGSSSFRYLEYYDHLKALRGCESGMRVSRAEAFMVDSFSLKRVVDAL